MYASYSAMEPNVVPGRAACGRTSGWMRSELPSRTYGVCSPSLRAMLSTAECVYEVMKTDLPMATRARTSCTMVVVLPVPGMPSSSA